MKALNCAVYNLGSISDLFTHQRQKNSRGREFDSSGSPGVAENYRNGHIVLVLHAQRAFF